MNSSMIIHVNEGNFEYEVIDYSNDIPVVVDFWAEWCVPCKMLDPILQKLVQERHGELRLAKVNVDENQNLAIRYNVRGIPAIKAFRNGEVVAEFSGVQPEPKIKAFFQELIPSPLDLNLEKANSLLTLGKWQQSEETFHQVLVERPGHPNALLGLAKSLLAQGKGSKARDILNAFPVSHEFSTAEKLQPVALALSRIEHGLPETDFPLEATYNHGLRLITIGNLPAAMDGLLDVLRRDKGFRNGECRQVILGIFEILGQDNPTTRQYQSELASILF